MAPPLISAFHSPDGLWWWNGEAWLPALSPDGRYWFDGRQWVRRPAAFDPSRRWTVRVPRRTWNEALVWLVLLGLWCPVTLGLTGHHASVSTLEWSEGSLGLLAVAATFAFGGGLGYRRLWRALALAIGAGTVVLLLCFSMITLVAPDPTNQNDHAAGVGAIILVVPAALVVGVILGAGASVGAACRWLRDRKAGNVAG